SSAERDVQVQSPAGDDRPCQGLLSEIELEHLAPALVPDEIEGGRQIAELGLLVQRSLHKKRDLVVAKPVGSRGLDAPRDQPRLGVVAAARAGADYEGDLLAGIEIRSRLGRRSTERPEQCSAERSHDQTRRAQQTPHSITSSARACSGNGTVTPRVFA